MRASRQQMIKDLVSIWALRLRSEKGLTQEKMSALLGVTPHTYSDMESGKRLVSSTTLLGLLNLMDPFEKEEFFLGIASMVEDEDKLAG